MYHSITFDERNTWDDWHLIPSTRPVFNPPPVKSRYVDIPGSDGEVDLTTIFSEYPRYGNRTGSFEFIVANGYLSWEETYATILTYFHGKELRAILEDNFEFFYMGRFGINEWRSDKNHSLIVLDYNVEPYKTDIAGASDLWLWDPFDFEYGLIQYYSNLVVNGTLTINVEGVGGGIETWLWDPFDFEYGVIQHYADLGFNQPVIPTFTASTSMLVTFNGVTYSLPAGISKIIEIVILPGENQFIFTGNGVITIEYGGRSL